MKFYVNLGHLVITFYVLLRKPEISVNVESYNFLTFRNCYPIPQFKVLSLLLLNQYTISCSKYYLTAKFLIKSFVYKFYNGKSKNGETIFKGFLHVEGVSSTRKQGQI